MSLAAGRLRPSILRVLKTVKFTAASAPARLFHLSSTQWFLASIGFNESTLTSSPRLLHWLKTKDVSVVGFALKIRMFNLHCTPALKVRLTSKGSQKYLHIIWDGCISAESAMNWWLLLIASPNPHTSMLGGILKVIRCCSLRPALAGSHERWPCTA